MTRAWERRRGLMPEDGAAGDVARGGFEPCLLALLRLSVGTGSGAEVTRGRLPRALARTGHLARAAELVCTITDELDQGEELLGLVKAAAAAGDLCGAQALAESIPLRQLRDQALVALVPEWARAGERDRAVAVAQEIRYPHNWGRAWALLAKAVVDTGDIDEALGFAARAEDEVSSYAVDGTEQVLALLVEVAFATGDHERAAVLADRVEEMTLLRGPTAWSKPRSLARVLAREVLDGDLDRLDALLRPPSGPAVGEGGALCGWVLGEEAAQDTVGEAGQAGPGLRPGLRPGRDESGGQGMDLDGGNLDESVVSLLSAGALLGASGLACVLDAVAESADQAVGLALAERAETLLETGDGRDHDILLRSVTLLLARQGCAERAMALADGLDPELRGGRQADVVAHLARSGDTAGAEALAYAIGDRRAQDRALVEVVRELARRGDTGRAEALVHSIDDRWAQGEALVAVARETARHGDPARAETLTRSIAYRASRARALVSLVELSEPSRARRLAAQAVALDGWAPVLEALERIAPRSVALVVDELTS
ncbi:hypothetical protein [Streptomyces sp. DSM 15324]|uniref:hypothetical protein n=1 Tax=Streptomyces sp. DSM 15324 TaxID=1739111 RepID=UPI00131C2077|nr:hypothetical protein [Streptomyces sp. DSM 15324]